MRVGYRTSGDDNEERKPGEREEEYHAYTGPSIQLSDVQCEVQCPPANSLVHMRRVK